MGFALLFVLFFMVDDFAKFMSFISLQGTMLLGADLKAVYLASEAFSESSKMLVVVLVVAWIAKGRFESPATKGDNALKKQNYQEALDLYLQAKEKNKEDTRLDIAIATCLLSLQRPQESYKYLDNVLKVDPKDVKKAKKGNAEKKAEGKKRRKK